MWFQWQQEWLLGEKVDFDGINKTILVHPEVTELDIRSDVYSAWVRWIPTHYNSSYLYAMRYTGLDEIPGGVTGDSYFLINGWKLLIDLRKVAVTGVLFSDNYDTAYYDYDTGISIYPTKVSSLVNTVNVAGGAGPSASQIRQEIDNNSTKLSQIKTKTDTISQINSQEIADTLRLEIASELSHLMSLQNNTGLTNTQATMLLEMYDLLGLDPTKPLIVNTNSRTAGTISQTIDSNSTRTIVSRN